MQKTLRIFRKDVFHLWPEILIAFGITLGFALTEHYVWPHRPVVVFSHLQLLVVWMNILMLVAWWVLIGRAVHDEPLVGDVQFWVTRPYGWQRLLSAKFIFTILFIVIPFFLTQCFLLHQAGLHPTAILSGLFYKVFLISVWVLLPLLALSAVTPSLTRMILIFLALIVYSCLVGFLTSALGPAAPAWEPGYGSPIWGWWALVLVPAMSAVVIVLQYARRRTSLSYGLLLGLVAVLTVAGIASVYSRNGIQQFSALTSNQAAPAQFALNPDPSLQVSQAQRANPSITNPQKLPLSLPLTLSGIAPGHAIRIDGRLLSFEADGVPHSTLAWAQDGGTYEADPAAPQQISQKFDLPRDVFAKTAGKSVTFHIQYAVTELEAVSSYSVAYTGASFDLPEQGRCYTIESIGAISCLYAIQRPSLTRITWTSQQACETDPAPGTPEEKWIGSEEREGSLNLGFSPVVVMDNMFATYELETRPHFDLHAVPHSPCPGSVLTLTRYRVVGHHLIDVTLPPLDPRSYVLPPKNDDPDE